MKTSKTTMKSSVSKTKTVSKTKKTYDKRLKERNEIKNLLLKNVSVTDICQKYNPIYVNNIQDKLILWQSLKKLRHSNSSLTLSYAEQLYVWNVMYKTKNDLHRKKAIALDMLNKNIKNKNIMEETKLYSESMNILKRNYNIWWVQLAIYWKTALIWKNKDMYAL